MIEAKKIKTELRKKLSGSDPIEKSSGAGICCCFVKLGKLGADSPRIGIKCFSDPSEAQEAFRFHNYLSRHPKFRKSVPKIFGKLFKIRDDTCYAVEEVYVGRIPKELRAKVQARYGKSITWAKNELADKVEAELKRKFPNHRGIIGGFMCDRHNGNYGYSVRAPYLVWVDFSI